MLKFIKNSTIHLESVIKVWVLISLPFIGIAQSRSDMGVVELPRNANGLISFRDNIKPFCKRDSLLEYFHLLRNEFENSQEMQEPVSDIILGERHFMFEMNYGHISKMVNIKYDIELSLVDPNIGYSATNFECRIESKIDSSFSAFMPCEAIVKTVSETSSYSSNLRRFAPNSIRREIWNEIDRVKHKLLFLCDEY